MTFLKEAETKTFALGPAVVLDRIIKELSL